MLDKIDIPKSIITHPASDIDSFQNADDSVDDDIEKMADAEPNCFDYTQLPNLDLEQIPKEIDILENV